MKKHIEKNLKYPKEAKESKIETRVIVTFEIEKDGKLTNIHTRGRRSEYQSLFEEEAKRIIELLPAFSPGLQRGKPVVVAYYIPISFKLDK
jgi:TonB family protein